MTPLVFFQSDDVKDVLQHAARCAATPVSVHYVEKDEEGPRVLGLDGCAVCTRAAALPGGRAACRASRGEAAQMALRRGTVMPFVCHLGLSCVSVPALGDSGFVLTFGPYCPGEAPQGLSAAVSSGLEALGDDADPDDARLVADVAVLPGQCVPAVAQGAAETLARMWSQRDAEDTEPVSLDADAPRRTETVPSPGKSHGGEAVALALSGADHARARGLVLATLAETESGTKVRIAVKRARAVAIVASALEAAERAGLATKRSWELFGAYVDQVKSARTEGALLNAAMAVLAPVKRAARKDATVGTGMRQLTALVTEHLEDGITLNEVAKTLGEHPTAITHRLQRKYGLSYSQYVGRLRVDKAKDILRRTQFSVKEVSRRVGISDPSNLSKLFRRFEGMSPQTYRSRFGRKR